MRQDPVADLGGQIEPLRDAQRLLVVTEAKPEALVERGDEPDAIVEFIAGMTDRYALAYAANL